MTSSADKIILTTAIDRNLLYTAMRSDQAVEIYLDFLTKAITYPSLTGLSESLRNL